MTLPRIANYDKAQWQDAAGRATDRAETRHFIDGDFSDAVDGGRFESINPATGEVIAEVAAGNAKDIDRAVLSWLEMGKR